MESKHISGQGKPLIERCRDIPVYTAGFDVLTQLTGFKLTRGMLCAMHRPPLPAPETVCAGARRIAVLENVMNPTNIGAIFRSAAALNIDAVLLTGACSNPLYLPFNTGQYGKCLSHSLDLPQRSGGLASAGH